MSKLSSVAVVFLASLLCLGSLCSGADQVYGIEQLYRLDKLPLLRDSVKVGSVSSYDRTGGNNDGFSGRYSFVRKEKDGLVLADLKGPGVITRIWTPTPTNDKIAFFFDGEKTPRIEVTFRGIFSGKEKPFEAPLSGYGAGGFYSYLPLPFEKSCKVLAKAEKVRFYQINYALYSEGTPITTFSTTPPPAYKKHLEQAKKLFSFRGEDLADFTLGKEKVRKVVKSRTVLRPGESVTIFETDKGGRIGGLRIGPAQALSGKNRRIVLKAFWDNEKEPALFCPAGDFFGYAWGKPAMQSLLLGTRNDMNYLYYPMPFEKAARVELHAEGTEGEPVTIESEVVFSPVSRQPGEGKFYCIWQRENPTTKGNPFTFIDTKGEGHLVGCIQQSQGMKSGNTYFFEGDDITTIDGEMVIHGTGSEDFYNGGWYDVPGRWETRKSFPLSGCLAYKKHLGRTGGYRLMLCDAYAYKKSIVQTIEHAPTKNSLINDYCGVTYLYSKERPACGIPLPPVRARKVVDLEKIIFAAWWNVPIHAFTFSKVSLSKKEEMIGKEKVQSLSMESAGNDWFGHPFISFICELPAAGSYRVSIDTVKGPAQGKVQIFVDEAPVGKVVDLYAEKREKASEVSLATLDLKEGDNRILFKVTGKNGKSAGFDFDVINIICEKESGGSADLRSEAKPASAVLVKENILENGDWKKVVDALVQEYSSTVITYKEKPSEALPALKEQFPQYLCVVAPPLDAGRQFVSDIHCLTRKLDDDPYTDLLWGIVTGYTAEDALRIVQCKKPLTVRKVASGTDVELSLCEEGRWYCELNKNRMVVKEPGGKPVTKKGPDDTTKALVDLLNVYQADLFVTSGHATERNWQIGYRYRNGKFISKAGQLTGVAVDGSTYPIESSNPKVYLPIGNCLMGHIDSRDAMALAFIHSAGVNQMIGYTVPTWYGYAGWGCLDYFVEQPGRFTFAEAWYANLQALIHRLEKYFPDLAGRQLPPGRLPRSLSITAGDAAKKAGLSAHDGRGLLHDRDVVAFYGNPLWHARMAAKPKRWSQELTVKKGLYTFTVTPNAGAKTFEPVNTNGSQRGGRPIFQLLPHRITSIAIEKGSDYKPVITDNFILVPLPETQPSDAAFSVVFRADRI